MSPELQPLGRALIFLGVILTGVGLVILVAPRIPWLGRLPGDIIIQRPRFSFYFPVVSCLFASLLLSLLMWLIVRFQR